MKRWFKQTKYKKGYEEIEKILNKKRSELEEANEKIILLQNDIHVKANKIELFEKELLVQDELIKKQELELQSKQNDIEDLSLNIQIKNDEIQELQENFDKILIENSKLLEEIEKLTITPSAKYIKDNKIPSGTHRIKLTTIDGKKLTLENVSINWQVTKNFALWEIACYQMYNKTTPKLVNGKKVYYKEQIVNMPYMAKLQEFRTKLGKPLTITSGYRNSTVNSIVKGITNSEHTLGRAMDLYTPGMTVAVMDQMQKLANTIFPSIGRYNSQKFFHLGDRDNWKATI